ncbi:CDP-glycerol glycerophosphotransferase family protein [Mycetocola spongiae]|uniref:CDP-glycerol glycerophosphotransferase family protein n=1 Tax=Mycetocola spongiae TaxID=2859226 RepID=UPI001CF1ECB3|nr:CDP-glycerol glycerophosphotransferase family protein [Mycetocola spongiae]UCR89084.1 CDP-glycerol glycerophosphotransferase family protein [Mycetocola spongiae]
MGVMSDGRKAVQLFRDALANRRARSELAGRLAALTPLERGHYKIAVYFADSKVNMYQIRQWYKPLAELSQTYPVVVLARAPTAATQLFEESPLDVAYVRTVTALESTLEEQDIRIVFYVNQNAKNFQMFRYGRCWHVFINHGESDKMYMTTNQFKAYDYAFIAGDAARERLTRALWDYDLERRALVIGRPQADHYAGRLPYTPDERTVVLYAPTWEGDREAAAYGSIATHGVALMKALLASPRHRVIYRPHPRSGVVDHAYGHANRQIIQAIEAANHADPSAHHVFDEGMDLGWQLAAADVAIVDISAMVYDRLAAGKPLLITRPVNPNAEIDTAGYLQACEWLSADHAANIIAETERVLHDPETVGRLEHWSHHYFGDTTPGETTKRFHAAVDTLMERWESFAEREARTGSATDPLAGTTAAVEAGRAGA